MKKIIVTEILFVLLFISLLILVLDRKEAKEVSVDAVEQAFLEETEETFEKYDALTLRRDFSLEASSFEYYLYYGQPDTMEIRTFVFLRAESESGREEAVKAFGRYIESQKKAFEGYGASQMKLLNDALIYENGPYAALIIHEGAGRLENMVRKLTEG